MPLSGRNATADTAAHPHTHVITHPEQQTIYEAHHPSSDQRPRHRPTCRPHLPCADPGGLGSHACRPKAAQQPSPRIPSLFDTPYAPGLPPVGALLCRIQPAAFPPAAFPQSRLPLRQRHRHPCRLLPGLAHPAETPRVRCARAIPRSPRTRGAPTGESRLGMGGTGVAALCQVLLHRMSKRGRRIPPPLWGGDDRGAQCARQACCAASNTSA